MNKIKGNYHEENIKDDKDATTNDETYLHANTKTKQNAGLNTRQHNNNLIENKTGQHLLRNYNNLAVSGEPAEELELSIISS